MKMTWAPLHGLQGQETACQSLQRVAGMRGQTWLCVLIRERPEDRTPPLSWARCRSPYHLGCGDGGAIIRCAAQPSARLNTPYVIYNAESLGP